MSAAAVIIIRQKRCIRRFIEAGAVSTEGARTPAELGCRDTWYFQKMVKAGAFVACGQGRYYVDVTRAEEYQRQKRIRMLVITGVLLMVFVLIMLYYI